MILQESWSAKPFHVMDIRGLCTEIFIPLRPSEYNPVPPSFILSKCKDRGQSSSFVRCV